ncbi:MAG TPA: hypothetical protein PKW33_03990 [Anaerolineaceae bacterium]|nr:hypothetical protein [Anaerolineaceae bacterium]HPN50722.1 hypothetical protein [Anaerolineaceae bacterium]
MKKQKAILMGVGFLTIWLALSLSTPAAGSASAAPNVFDCSIVTDVPLTECQALVDLYDTAGGSTWTAKTGWRNASTVCSWFGVTCTGGHVSGLDLNNNGLAGPLPAGLGNLTSLVDLNLSGNALSGPLPAGLGSLTALKNLDLSQNGYLTGSLPALNTLTQLESLSLYNNQLSGSIPAWVGSLSRLTVLDLAGNEFSGVLPAELGNLASLTVLRLDTNRLEGHIPASLGSLSALAELSLSYNGFYGDFPAAVASLPVLTQVFVSYNCLTANPSVGAWLSGLDPAWANTQTVPPSGLQVQETRTPALVYNLSWTPIAYQADGGYYEISSATQPGGPWFVHGQTASKAVSTYTVTGLTDGVPYYIRVRSYTPAHDNQMNNLTSQPGLVLAGFKVLLPAVLASFSQP